MLKRFGWPPDVTRRQTRRDLLLVLDGAENGTFEGRSPGDVPDF